MPFSFNQDPEYGTFARIYEFPNRDKKNSPWVWGVRLCYVKEVGDILENIQVKTTDDRISEIEKIRVVKVYNGKRPASICEIVGKDGKANKSKNQKAKPQKENTQKLLKVTIVSGQSTKFSENSNEYSNKSSDESYRPYQCAAPTEPTEEDIAFGLPF